jgi:hypothetical protein
MIDLSTMPDPSAAQALGIICISLLVRFLLSLSRVVIQ